MVTETYPRARRKRPRTTMGSGPTAGHDRRDGIERRPPGRSPRPEEGGNIMRKLVVLIPAALALGHRPVTGVLCARTGRHGPRPGRAPDPAVTSVPTSPSSPRHAGWRPHPAATPPAFDASPEPTADPTALADGIYPTFVRAVDLDGATVEVDVLQRLRWGRGAPGGGRGRRVVERCSLQPRLHPEREPAAPDAPGRPDAHIKLLGMCEAPSRSIGLKELRNATTPFTDTFYYDVTVVGGSHRGHHAADRRGGLLSPTGMRTVRASEGRSRGAALGGGGEPCARPPVLWGHLDGAPGAQAKGHPRDPRHR